MITKLRLTLAKLVRDERGLTAVEYAVLGGIIVGALALTIGPAFTTALGLKFTALIP